MQIAFAIAKSSNGCVFKLVVAYSDVWGTKLLERILLDVVRWREASRAEKIKIIMEASSNEEAIHLLRGLYELKHVTIRLAAAPLGLFDIPYIRTTYAAEWIAHQLTRGYIGGDQVVVHGFTTERPFFWSDLERTRIWNLIMRDAMQRGVGPEGFSIPVHDRFGRRSLISLNTFMPSEDWKRYISTVAKELLEIAQVLHENAVRESGAEEIVRLGPREIECLQWVARGKDAGDIAEILEISEHTVRHYLKSAREKLNSRTLPHAVSKAIAYRVIR